MAKPHTVKDTELDDLARCLDALRMHRHDSTPDAWFGRGNLAVVFTRKDGKIATIGPIDPKGDDAKLPTFAADFDTGTHTVPNFADAIRRHEVIDAIERSAASGERVRVAAAPSRGPSRNEKSPGPRLIREAL